jgi:F-type H+-transporting ATPase subunit delta
VRDSTVARNYAEALFDLGERHGAHDEFAAASSELSALLQADRRIRTFLEMPKIEERAKKEALRRALGGRVPPLFLNFVLVVVGKRRQRLLGDIATQYRALLDEKLGRLHVEVTLAHQPDAAAEQRITAELGRILGRTVLPNIHVDPALLGGIVVRYGDRVLDGSLRRRLQSLRTRMVEAALPGAAHAGA